MFIRNIFIIVFVLIAICSCLNVQIVNVMTNDSFNERLFPRFNPINGTDYWKSRIICCEESVLWSCEFENEEMLEAIEIDFDMPPSNLIIYGEADGKIPLPIYLGGYNEKIRENIESKKNIFVSSRLDFNFTFPVKRLIFKMQNNFKIKFHILLAKLNVLKKVDSFLISTIKYTNTGFHQYCFKIIENSRKDQSFLSYEDCYYCLMYDLRKCLFKYENSTSLDFKFSPLINPDKKFFLTNNYENFMIQGFDEYNLNQKQKNSLRSYIEDEIDYKQELANVISNSTLSPEYNVFYIFDAMNQYWSSALYKEHPCPNIEIKIILSDTITIKRIDINWLKVPNSLEMKICMSEDECVYNQKFPKLDPKELLFKNNQIFSKGKIIYLRFFPNEEYSNYCLVQIQSLKIYRNQIFVKLNTSSNDKKYTKSFFYLYPIKNKLSIEKSKKVLKWYEETNIMYNNITQSKSLIENHMDTKTIEIFNSMRFLVNEREKLNENIVRVSEILKSFLTNSTLIEKNATLDNSSYNLKDNSSYILFYYREDLNDMVDFYQNNIKSSKKFKDFYNILKVEFDEYKNLLNANSYRFSGILIDKYNEDIKTKIEMLINVNNFIEKISLYRKEKVYIEILESVFKKINSFSEIYLKKNLEKINLLAKSDLQSKIHDMKKLSERLQIILQSVRLIKFENYPIYLKTNQDIKSCKLVKIVKNAYYSNMMMRFLVKFSPNTLKNEEIIILKFLNDKFFFYLIVNFDKIEYWKIKYGNKKKLFEIVHKTNKDKESNLSSYSKILYFLIKINNNRIDIYLKIAYENLPIKITKYLEGLKFDNLNDIIRVMDINDNYFDDVFKPNKKITSIHDRDLVNLMSFIGLYHSNPKKNSFIYINLTGLALEKRIKKNQGLKIYTLKTKDKSFYAEGLANLITEPVFYAIRDFLKLTDIQVKSYETNMELIDEFYLKFNLNLEILTENIYIVFRSKIKREIYFLEIKNLLSHTVVLFYFLNWGKRKALIKLKFRNNSKLLKFPVYLTRIYDTLKINIESNTNKDKPLFLTLKNFSFFKVSLILNNNYEKAVTDIFISESSVIKRKATVEEKCSLKKYKQYKCLLDLRICRIKFCQNCCNKKNLIIKFLLIYKECYYKCINSKMFSDIKKNHV